MNNVVVWNLPFRTIAQRCGAVFLSTLVAVFGPVAVEAVVSPLYRPNSGQSAILKIWILDVTVAAALGLIMQHSRRSPGARWAWVLPAVVFAGKASSYLLAQNNIFGHFSGLDCSIELHGPSCNDFLLFTIPLIRSVSYSVAAGLVTHQH
jgi:hypothetical protein